MHSNRCRMATWGLGLVLAGWLLAGLPGCCSHYTRDNYGQSVEHNLASQIVDPKAGQTVYVSRGQSPDAAANAYAKYIKSFKPGEKPQVLKLTTGEGY
jgi:hypothetical protein